MQTSFTKSFTILSKIPSNYNQLKMYNNGFFDSFINKYEVSVYQNSYEAFNNKQNNNETIYFNIKEYNNNGLFSTTICANSKNIGSIFIFKDTYTKKIYIDYFISNTTNTTNKQEIKRIIFELAENIAKDNNYLKIYLEIDQNKYNSDNLKDLGFIFNENNYSVFDYLITEKTIHYNK